MGIVFSLFPLLVAVIVGAVFARFYFGGRSKAPEESGLAPVFEEQAGGRFNGFHLTIPFVRHAIYDDFVVISYGNKKHILKLREIVEVSNERHVFSKGLTYRHKKGDIPNQCIVWSTDGAKVIEILRSKGVQIRNIA